MRFDSAPRRSPLIAAASLLFGACSAPTHRDDPMPAPTRKLTPYEAPAYEPGPSLTPRVALLAWIRTAEAAPEQPMSRVPVTVELRTPGPMGLGDAWLGLGELGPESTRVRLRDGALGIALVDRVAHRCPAPATRCALWLEGRWGEHPPGIPAAADETAAVPEGTAIFSVMHVGAAITEAPAEPHTRIHVERRTP
jgi:hypothetical protein